MKRLLLVFVLMLVLVAPAAAQEGKVLRIDLQQEADSLNPMYHDQWFGALLNDLMLSPTWYFDNNLQAVPILVTEMPSTENGGINEDGTVITLTLRDDIVWSDGEPITSADFVFTYNMVIDPANTPLGRYPYENIKSVEAPDPQTVVVTFNETFAPWQAWLFTLISPLPQHVLQPVFDAEGTLDNAAWNREPTVTSGPFKFQEWQAGSSMTLVANENYFNGAPKLDSIFIRFVAEDTTIAQALIAGDTDVATYIPFPDTPPLEEAGTIEFVLAPSGYNEAWFFNVNPDTTHPAMLDVNVRKALAMAFDRDKINTDLNAGQTYTPASFWEATPYARPDATPIPYDVAEATRLLDEAGWVDSDNDGIRDKDGVKLELRYVSNERQVRMQIQAIVQQALGDLGVSIQTFNYPSIFDSYANGGVLAIGDFDIAEWSSNPAWPDPDTSQFLCSEITTADNPDGANSLGYCNEQVDALFAEQARTLDPAARTEIFHQIDQLMTDDVIWVGIWFDADLWTFNEKVLNTEFSGADPWWNAVNWDIAS
jgi:peptide/nickel transport system substrate-binding protein